jgi:hypothetical protein
MFFQHSRWMRESQRGELTSPREQGQWSAGQQAQALLVEDVTKPSQAQSVGLGWVSYGWPPTPWKPTGHGRLAAVSKGSEPKHQGRRLVFKCLGQNEDMEPCPRADLTYGNFLFGGKKHLLMKRC